MSGRGTASVPENQDNNKWFKNGVNLIKHNLKRTPITHTAKSAILFVGDGMSVTTVTAARILQGQMRTPRESGEENVLSWEYFPWTALSKTYNVDQQVSDSAGTATAFVVGVKTNAGERLIDLFFILQFIYLLDFKLFQFDFTSALFESNIALLLA